MRIFRCPKCYATLEVPDDYKDGIICPRCGTKIFH